jgi:hypothetical protein
LERYAEIFSGPSRVRLFHEKIRKSRRNPCGKKADTVDWTSPVDADSANFESHSVAIVLGLWDIVDGNVSLMIDDGRWMKLFKYLEENIDWIKGICWYSVGTTAIHRSGILVLYLPGALHPSF